MGLNSASYKFALAKALLNYEASDDSVIRLEDLATPFAKNICEHLRLSEKQNTRGSGTFIDSLKKYNNGAAIKIAPPITNPREGSQVPKISRNAITFAGLVILDKVRPKPKINPLKSESTFCGINLFLSI